MVCLFVSKFYFLLAYNGQTAHKSDYAMVVMVSNVRIDKVHCRALRVVFQNFDANISDLLALEFLCILFFT